MPTSANATCTVRNVAKSGFIYSGTNHDVVGGSHGTAITVLERGRRMEFAG